MALLGLDPREHRIGRAALEAAGREIDLRPDEVAFRANLVTIRDGVMEDYSAGGIATEEARPLVEAVAAATGPLGVKIHLGVGYRHLMIVADKDGELDEMKCTPPHDIQGEPVAEHRPRGPGAERLNKIVEAADRALDGLSPKANAVWPWGQGRARELPTLEKRFGMRGAVISAVDLVRGIGRLMGMEAIEVEGATGDLDTNYAGKGRAACAALEKYDLVFVHVEAPDEASHRGDLEGRTRAIEEVDGKVVGPVLEKAEELRSSGESARVLVLPDHLTPLSLRTHARGPVPFALWPAVGTSAERTSRPKGEDDKRPGAAAFSEAEAASSGLLVERGWELLAFALGREAVADECG